MKLVKHCVNIKKRKQPKRSSIQPRAGPATFATRVLHLPITTPGFLPSVYRAGPPHRRGRGAAGPRAAAGRPALRVMETSESVGWQNFGKMLLVFGCIGTYSCKKNTRFTTFFKIYQIIKLKFLNLANYNLQILLNFHIKC